MAQLGRRARQQAFPKAWGADRKQLLAHEPFLLHVGPATGAEAHGAIGLGTEFSGRHAHVQGEVDVRQLRAKVSQTRHHPAAGEGRHERQHDALARVAGRLREAAFKQAQSLADLDHQQLALFGGPHAILFAYEQPYAEPGLQRGHVMTDRAMREVQFLGGPGVATMTDCSFEGLQGCQGREPDGLGKHVPVYCEFRSHR